MKKSAKINPVRNSSKVFGSLRKLPQATIHAGGRQGIISNGIKESAKQNAIVLYKEGGDIRLDVRLEKETVWLGTRQMALLFGTQRPAIVKHISNIYKSGELEHDSTCSILEQVAADGKVRKINLYNLDAIISVGYRVNSKRATQFRIWATKTLKEYLVKGYAVNEKRLLETKERFAQLQNTVAFLQRKSRATLLAGQEKEILDLLGIYAKTLTILDEYDKGVLREARGARAKFILAYQECIKVIAEIKHELVAKKEAGDLFGAERGGAFEGIIKGLYQTFGKQELYKTLESKAAHLLYLIIKDHPFSDGNKRIASFLFVYFLDKNNALYRSGGEKKINDNALAALALLVAESDPTEKDQMIALITQLLQ